MPREFLRDVLRSGDAAGRTRRRLSVLPISIAAHVAAAMILVIIPLGAEPDMPPIFSPLRADTFIRTASPPSPPPPEGVTPRVQPTRGAPISAAPDIAPEPAVIPYPSGPVVEGAITGVGSGVSGPPTEGLIVPPPPDPAPPATPPRIVRAGSGIREPKKLVHVAPEYPEIARRARIEGTVILEAVLDVSGRVASVRLLRSNPLLDEAAIKAVSAWRYSPTELNGVPVPVLLTITVQFQLNR